MDYELLSKWYYKDKAMYKTLYANRYNSESTIKFDLKILTNDSFIFCNFEMLNLISAIRSLDKNLDNLAMKLPSIALNQFTKRCLIDEISLTNELEGVQSTRKEINDIIINKYQNETRQRLYGLVKKYQLLAGEKIQVKTCEDIRKIYDELVLNEVAFEDPSNIPDGLYFRKGPVEVQNKHLKTIHRGIAPEKSIIEYMDMSLNILNDESIDIIIRIALFHYLFGYIHPFYDGNGRTSRFISSYLLATELNPLVSYSLSYNIKKNISSYYNAFKYSNDSKNKGDLTPFVLLFLEILKKALLNLCKTLKEKISTLDNLYQVLKNKVTNKDLETLFILLQNTLFGEDGLSVYELAKILQVSVPTIRNTLKQNTQLLKTEKEFKTLLYKLDLDVLLE